LSSVNLCGAILEYGNFESATMSEVRLINTRLAHADLSAVSMPFARMMQCDLSHTALTEGELWSAQLWDSAYPSADIRGTNLERTGIYRHQALDRYPDLRYSDSTRWDDPDRRRIFIASPSANPAPRRSRGPRTPIRDVGPLPGLRDSLSKPTPVQAPPEGMLTRLNPFKRRA
ncbi:MAG: pentapeptide repeat-containing protein, partial [Arenicellales bacterium]